MTNKSLITLSEMKKPVFLSIMLLAGMSASANTVLLDENFNGPWNESFPIVIEGDHLNPASNIFTLFTNYEGVAQPWWPLKDSSTSEDRFLTSHSIYSDPGQSNDWICSKPLYIETTGFNLTFGAQSQQLRTGEKRPSDLWVFVTEEPVSYDYLPDASTAAMHIEKVSEGADPNILEGDFPEFTLSLDPWAGKTVYVSFANLNYDKDFLAIDNVLVERLDIVELTADLMARTFKKEAYVEAGAFDVLATLRATDYPGASNWNLTFEVNGETVARESGEKLDNGDNLSFTFTGNVGASDTAYYTLTFTADDMQPVVRHGHVSGLAFTPYRRVLVEESTGMWCGNCPMGIYNMEKLSENPETKEYAIPVSVHITGSGQDNLVDLTYSGMLGLNAAPLYRVDRDVVVRTFSVSDCGKFDPSVNDSFAGVVRRRHEQLTLLDIDMKADYIIQGNDTTGVKCRVTVNPACNVNTSNFRIGFAMKENNVHADSPLMVQANYLSGDTSFPEEISSWINQPDHVRNLRFHDVARGVWSFNGVAGSMPDMLTSGQPYEYDYELQIPDTYYAQGSAEKPIIGSPAIKTDFVTMIAYIIDLDDQSVVNAVAVPMSDIAEVRYDNFSSVEDIAADITGSDSEAEYFNMQGMRVANPTAGIYIVRRGSKTTKEIVR